MATPERLKIEEQAEALYEFYRKEHPDTCPDVPWVGLFGDTQEKRRHEYRFFQNSTTMVPDIHD